MFIIRVANTIEFINLLLALENKDILQLKILRVPFSLSDFKILKKVNDNHTCHHAGKIASRAF